MEYDNSSLTIFHKDVETKTRETREALEEISKTLDVIRIHTRMMERYEKQMQDRPFDIQVKDWEATIREETQEKLEGYTLDVLLDMPDYKHFRVINGGRMPLMVVHTAPYDKYQTAIALHTKDQAWNLRVDRLPGATEPMPLFNHEQGNYLYWAEKLVLTADEEINPPYEETVPHMARKWAEEWATNSARDFYDVDETMVNAAAYEAGRVIESWKPLTEILDDLMGITIGGKQENTGWTPFDSLDMSGYPWAVYTPEWIRTCEILSWTARKYIEGKETN